MAKKEKTNFEKLKEVDIMLERTQEDESKYRKERASLVEACVLERVREILALCPEAVNIGVWRCNPIEQNGALRIGLRIPPGLFSTEDRKTLDRLP
jgi:hypothetical protein